MIPGNHDEFMALFDEFRECETYQELEMTYAEFAALLGVSERTLYRWKKRVTPVPLTAIFLLRLMLKQEREVRREFA